MSYSTLTFSPRIKKKRKRKKLPAICSLFDNFYKNIGHQNILLYQYLNMEYLKTKNIANVLNSSMHYQTGKTLKIKLFFLFKECNLHKQCFYHLFLLLFCLCFDLDYTYRRFVMAPSTI